MHNTSFFSIDRAAVFFRQISLEQCVEIAYGGNHAQNNFIAFYVGQQKM